MARLGGAKKQWTYKNWNNNFTKRNEKETKKRKEKEIKKTKVTKSYYIVHSHFSKCLHVYVVLYIVLKSGWEKKSWLAVDIVNIGHIPFLNNQIS